MQEYKKAIQIASWTGLLFCLLILSKYILFKKSPQYYKHYFSYEYKHYSISQGWKHANTVPFHTITLFSSDRVSSEYRYMNIGGNIVGFIPLGILLPLALPFAKKWWQTLLLVFGISLSFETIQLFTGIGVFDVDDLLLNTAGGMAGYILFLVARRLMRTETTYSSAA
jgi:glycopeptide antibiotics resistance protein